MKKERAMEIYNLLDSFIENPKSELNYTTLFELLVAVVLSAQCTDKRVNIVTEKMFKTHNKPEHFAYMKQEDLEKMIYSTGFYKNKAKSIIEASKIIVEKHGGQVPDNFEDLNALPGVGRKTANVILIVGFNKPAIPVDTHVFRVSNRLGLTKAKNVLETEKQLAELYDESLYTKLHHLLILYGRYYCTARNPKCHLTPLAKYCNHNNEFLQSLKKK